MKHIEIKYNPYLIKTEISIDGKPLKKNSNLNVDNKRIQEWVDKLPSILHKECRDENFNVLFIGTLNDYEDVKTSFESYKKQENINVSFDFQKKDDVDDIERKIDDIFRDIQNGPIPELKDQRIVSAFQKAKDSRFEVNVVATMSSGKSTLINALLGKRLMPAANEATTATIVKIVDTEQDNFSATAYDESGKEVKKFNNITAEEMKELNTDPKVSTVEIEGRIPFVSSTGMKLVLVDTPGPNNARNKNHQEMTYKMVSDSDKSLVLFVMNGQQLGINDEKYLLDYICDNMKKGGKQSRERFIFAVNKMDAFSPKDEGEDCIERALENAKKGLEERGILNPNIFPVSAGAAIEKRTNDDEPAALTTFRMRAKKYDALHFEKYTQYSNLPQSAQKRIEEAVLSSNDDDTMIEIHTGIVSIEQAIAQYVNKYARVTKIQDLVSAFNSKLEELSTYAHLEDSIRKDKNLKKELDEKIENIKVALQSAENAKNRASIIDNIDVKETTEKSIREYVNNLKNKINKIILSQRNDVDESRAYQELDQLQKEAESISIQVNIEINKILENVYQNTINKVLTEYQKYFDSFGFKIGASSFSFNASNLKLNSLSNFSSLLERHRETKDQGYYETYQEQIFVPSKKKWYNPISWFTEKGDHYETVNKQRWISRYTSTVNVKDAANDIFSPIKNNIDNTEKEVISYVVSEAENFKKGLKKILEDIEEKKLIELDNLSKIKSDSDSKEEEIAIKEQNLKWLEDIQKRVNSIY